MSKKGNRSTSASAAFVVVNIGELKAAHASGGGTVRADVLHPGEHHTKHSAMGKGSRSRPASRFWLMEDNGTYKMICYGGHLEMEHDGSVVWKGKATDEGFETTTTSLPARKCATLLDLALVGEKLKYGAHSGPSRATESEPVAKKSAAKRTAAKKAAAKSAAAKRTTAPKNAAAKKTVPKKDAKWTVEVSVKGFEGRPLATYYFATKEDAETFAANEQKLLVAQENDHVQAVVKKKAAPKKAAPKKTAAKRTAPKKTAAKRTTAARKTAAKKTAPKKTAPEKTAAAESKGVAAVETYTVSGQHGETVVSKDVRIQRPAGVSQKRIQGILDRLPPGKSRLSTVSKQLAKHGAAFVPWDDGKPGDNGAYETAVKAPAKREPPAPASGPRPSKRGKGADEAPPTSRSSDIVDDARFLDDLHAELKKAKAVNLFETAKAIWLAGGREKAMEHMAATKGRSLVKAFLDWMDQHEEEAQAMLAARAS